MKPGKWKELVGGHRYVFGRDNHLSLTVQQLAHALSQINRYTGHTRKPYSVAQHCVHCSEYLDFDAGWAMAALLHDAPEIIIGDLSSPLKWHLGQRWMAPVRAEEARAMRCIAHALGVPRFAELSPIVQAAVKQADLVAMMTEKRDLLDPSCQWSDYSEWPAPHPARIEPSAAPEAARLFVRRFKTLKRRLQKCST